MYGILESSSNNVRLIKVTPNTISQILKTQVTWSSFISKYTSILSSWATTDAPWRSEFDTVQNVFLQWLLFHVPFSDAVTVQTATGTCWTAHRGRSTKSAFVYFSCFWTFSKEKISLKFSFLHRLNPKWVSIQNAHKILLVKRVFAQHPDCREFISPWSGAPVAPRRAIQHTDLKHFRNKRFVNIGNSLSWAIALWFFLYPDFKAGFSTKWRCFC